MTCKFSGRQTQRVGEVIGREVILNNNIIKEDVFVKGFVSKLYLMRYWRGGISPK